MRAIVQDGGESLASRKNGRKRETLREITMERVGVCRRTMNGEREKGMEQERVREREG